MKHTCHASNCNNNCPPEKLMCYPCWSLVSKDTQDEVYRTYTKGQCYNVNLIKKEWFAAVREAIKEVRLAKELKR